MPALKNNQINAAIIFIALGISSPSAIGMDYHEQEQIRMKATIQKVLDNNGPFDQRMHPYDQVPLMLAARIKQGQAFIEQLFAKGADCTVCPPLPYAHIISRIEESKTVLQICAQENAVESAKAIITHCKRTGIDLISVIDAKDYCNSTPLHYACYRAHLRERDDGQMVKLLLENGADPNARTSSGEPPFFAVVYRLHLATAEHLLFALEKKKKILEYCYAFGADFSIKNGSGKTILELADEYFKKPNSPSKGMVLYACAFPLRFDGTSYFSQLPSELMHSMGQYLSDGYAPELKRNS